MKEKVGKVTYAIGLGIGYGMALIATVVAAILAYALYVLVIFGVPTVIVLLILLAAGVI